MSGSFWPSCQVNLGKLRPRSGPAAGEGEAVGGESGAGGREKERRLAPEGPVSTPLPRIQHCPA